jgi:cytoskeleton protein RodZ
MSELGQWLREARQAKGLSLEMVEAETRIRSPFLTALEEDNYDELPAEVHTKGFLRNYALFLGLDPAEALEKYERREASRQDGAPSLFRPLEVTLFRVTGERLRIRLLLVLLIVALLTAGLWAWRTGRLAWPPPLALFQPAATPRPSHTPMATFQLLATVTKRATATPEFTATQIPSPTPPPTLTATALPRPTSTFTASPSPTLRIEPATPTITSEPATPTVTSEPATAQPPEEPTESPTPSITLEPGTGVTLSITVTEESWIEVTLDSLNDFRELLSVGEQRSWQAQREIILRLGNAGGVEVTVNGEFLGNLGERQQVVEFAWGPEGEVTPAPTVTATPETPRPSR